MLVEKELCILSFLSDPVRRPCSRLVFVPSTILFGLSKNRRQLVQL